MPWISLHGAAVTAQSLMGEVTLTPSPFDFRQLINLAHKDQRPDKGMNPAMHNCITSHVPGCPPCSERKHTAAEPSTYYRTPNSHTLAPRPTTTKNITVQTKRPSGENTYTQRTKSSCLHKGGYPAPTAGDPLIVQDLH